MMPVPPLVEQAQGAGRHILRCWVRGMGGGPEMVAGLFLFFLFLSKMEHVACFFLATRCCLPKNLHTNIQMLPDLTKYHALPGNFAI